MQEVIKKMISISTTKFWSNFFKKIYEYYYVNGNYINENIRLTKKKIYYGEDYVDITKYDSYDKIYFYCINMFSKYIEIVENWSEIRKNIKIYLIENFANNLKVKYKLDEKSHEKLLNILKLVLFSNGANNRVKVINNKIVNVDCIKYKNNNFVLTKKFKFEFKSRTNEKNIIIKNKNKFK